MFATALGQILIGWLIADFACGCVHWWEDRVGSEAMPVIGPCVIAPNRLHHRDAMAFMRKSLLKRNWTAFPVLALFVTAWWVILGPSLILLSAAVGGALAVEVHYQAHLPSTTSVGLRAFLRPLWDIGLVQSPAVHNKHHRWPDESYCPLTGWLNPILDATHFWRGLEALLCAVRLTPNKGTA